MSDAAPPPAPRPYVGSGRNGLITEGDARALLDEQARSGMTLQAFAIARGLEPQRLSWWKSKFAGKHDRPEGPFQHRPACASRRRRHSRLEHRLHACPRCAGPVAPVDDPSDRLEYEAVARALHTARHVLHAAWCPRCRRKVRTKAPLALPGCSYGPHAHTTLATLRATTGATVGDPENFAREVTVQASSVRS